MVSVGMQVISMVGMQGHQQQQCAVVVAGGVAKVWKEDDVKVGKVMWDDGWWKKLG